MLSFVVSYSQPGRKAERSDVKQKRYFHQPKTSPWIYRKTVSGPIQEGELPKLFKWNITSNKRIAYKIIEQQNKQRMKNRIRGNQVFHRRKYF